VQTITVSLAVVELHSEDRVGPEGCGPRSKLRQRLVVMPGPFVCIDDGERLGRAADLIGFSQKDTSCSLGWNIWDW
jgi:hypothetical protein